LKITLKGPAEPEDRGTVFVVRTVPEQRLPENTLKVTVPVGVVPPVIVAVSATEFPTSIELADRAVVIEGVAFPTERDSEPQRLVETPLLASPL